MQGGQPTRPLRILVVDDERLIAITTRAILDGEGFETAIAFNGDEAIALAKTFRPDFLLTDVVMPVRNGVEAAMEITRLQPNCKVLLISGNDGAGAINGAPAFELLSKPVPPSVLLSKINSICQAER